jgi:hypothetical protein
MAQQQQQHPVSFTPPIVASQAQSPSSYPLNLQQQQQHQHQSFHHNMMDGSSTTSPGQYQQQTGEEAAKLWYRQKHQSGQQQQGGPPLLHQALTGNAHSHQQQQQQQQRSSTLTVIQTGHNQQGGLSTSSGVLIAPSNVPLNLHVGKSNAALHQPSSGGQSSYSIISLVQPELSTPAHHHQQSNHQQQQHVGAEDHFQATAIRPAPLYYLIPSKSLVDNPPPSSSAHVSVRSNNGNNQNEEEDGRPGIIKSSALKGASKKERSASPAAANQQQQQWWSQQQQQNPARNGLNSTRVGGVSAFQSVSAEKPGHNEMGPHKREENGLKPSSLDSSSTTGEVCALLSLFPSVRPSGDSLVASTLFPPTSFAFCE